MTRCVILILLLLGSLQAGAQAAGARDTLRLPVIAPAPVKQAFENFLVELQADTATVPPLAVDACEDYVLVWVAHMSGSGLSPSSQDSASRFCKDMKDMQAFQEEAGKRRKRGHHSEPVSYRLEHNSYRYKVIVITRETGSIDEAIYYYARKRGAPPR